MNDKALPESMENPAISTNVDIETVEGFGKEWSRFDQSGLDDSELAQQFDHYFNGFPWESLPNDAVGFDLGCGSGRWASIAADRVGRLHCFDASDAALAVARKNLAKKRNVEFHLASVDEIPLEDGSMDFGYSLGVLHHVPDTAGGIKSCVAKLKPGAPFLLYLYYAFDNRPPWFRTVWKLSDRLRRLICSLPFWMKKSFTDVIATLVYFPLARIAYILERTGIDVDPIPLAAYRKNSFYTMRTDSLDRFGTRLEQRFSCGQIRNMMEAAGLESISFSDLEPYWCAIGYKR
jgi:SAM-dependent methyltransferase